MSKSFALRTHLRNTFLGAICIAFLFRWAVAGVAYPIKVIVAEACIRLINYFIRTSSMHPLLPECEISWRIIGGELWLGFLGGLAAVMVAGWLYAREKRVKQV